MLLKSFLCCWSGLSVEDNLKWINSKCKWVLDTLNDYKCYKYLLTGSQDVLLSDNIGSNTVIAVLSENIVKREKLWVYFMNDTQSVSHNV